MKRLLLAITILFILVACNGQVNNQQNSTPASHQQPTKTPEVVLTEDQTMDLIEQQVIDIRGLTSSQDVDRALLSDAELRENVINDFFSDYTAEEAADDSKELYLLGLLAEDFDLYQFYIDLYSEQVAGYYDPETKEMYVVADNSFGAIEQITYSHEYAHVLQDQTYDMQNGLLVNDDYCETHTEYCGAVSALVEGDASLVEQEWFLTNGTPQQYDEIMEFYATYESPVYDSAPAYMQQDFLFPYMQGLEFVNYIFNLGGWEAVDEVYLDPPVDTEQILHPEAYPNDVPMDVPMPDFTSSLGAGWRESTRNVMGEWYWYLILAFGNDAAYRLDEETAATATTGWGGDSYLVYLNDTTGQFALYMRTRWDSSKDANEFWSAIKEYGTLRWGISDATTSNSIKWYSTNLGYVTVQKEGNEIIWIIAPTAATAGIFLGN